MWQYAVKVIVSALIIVAVSEIGKRNSFWASALASLPLVSLLAFVWLYLDTGDTDKVIALSRGVFWLVLPSLVLFISLPLLIRNGLGFWLSLGLACIATAAAYLSMVKLLDFAGVRL